MRTEPEWTPTIGDRTHLVQGEFRVSDSPGDLFTTTLGSCIACCLHDPVRGAGGMNHFLLPHGEDATGPEAIRYGAHAIELLINGLLRMGAAREHLQARIFGGASISPLLPDIGGQNARFAARYLEHEGIRLLPGSVGGGQARRIQFWPATGRARQLLVGAAGAVRDEAVRVRARADEGSVEFFEKPDGGT
ncbi:MAG: chemotaxis protein CheD [Pseudomonadota bacterium]